jgi:hypothetical protein
VTTAACINGGEPGHGGHIGGTREPRGRFLALQPAEASFKPREVMVTHDLVAVRQVIAAVSFVRTQFFRNMSATRRVTRAKMGFSLAQAFLRADSRKRFGVVGKIRSYSGALRCSPWCVSRAKGVIVAFRPFARLARDMINGVKRFS